MRQEARDVVLAADQADQVPVLVAYNLPFRDCAQYSAGGARSTAEYEAWVDAVARGIGSREAVVILEPDGLGIIPWYTNAAGELEWCQPAEADPATAAAERFEQLDHAVDALTRLSSTAVYLDGTHSDWLSVGEVSDRLLQAGVERTDGFFLSVSNYQETEDLVDHGEWISRCTSLGTRVEGFDPTTCASQDPPSTAAEADAWYERAFAEAGLGFDPDDAAHFVIDTSRNGRGPWTPTQTYPDPQVWCNPPDRGLGLRPTTDTGHPLLDAHLWVKVPGESDGQCYRGTSGPQDPARGAVDPAAGQWFPEQARELIELADPPV
ncbi:glycoside hydrolase family 6 protein [Quadrisphaera sp. DSM 44207]|uniref:glycoside hydrolase family 6 protein n=1 Tax=Quadrisphaera sp. DSM 44207 TaxID=1881057 RepID=UPI000B2678B4